MDHWGGTAQRKVQLKFTPAANNIRRIYHVCRVVSCRAHDTIANIFIFRASHFYIPGASSDREQLFDFGYIFFISSIYSRASSDREMFASGMQLLLLATACVFVHGGPTTLTVNGAPATLGTFAFPAQAMDVVFDNGLIKLTFGVVTNTQYNYVTISATSVVVNDADIAHNITGESTDPEANESFYVDEGGGKGTALRCTSIKILRLSSTLVEAAWVDDRSTPLQHEHHLIMTSTMRGLYGYNILYAPGARVGKPSSSSDGIIILLGNARCYLYFWCPPRTSLPL